MNKRRRRRGKKEDEEELKNVTLFRDLVTFPPPADET